MIIYSCDRAIHLHANESPLIRKKKKKKKKKKKCGIRKASNTTALTIYFAFANQDTYQY